MLKKIDTYSTGINTINNNSIRQDQVFHGGAARRGVSSVIELYPRDAQIQYLFNASYIYWQIWPRTTYT